MTSAALPYPTNGEGRWAKIATRTAHYTPLMWIGVIILLEGTVSLTRGRPLWLYMLCALPSAAFMYFTLKVEHWHQYNLCSVCASKVPLDPDAKIKQKYKRLKFLHWFNDHPRLTKWSQIALMIFVFLPGYFGRSAFVVWGLYIALLEYLLNTHRPLQPWCRWCRGGWGEGGEEEKTPTPDPSEKVEA